MATTVGQHSVAAFTSPVNGTTPIDANTVRGNDNTVRVAYVDHDADPGIHVQSSTLASRPVAGTAGRKWITEDSGLYTLWFDDGTNWHPVSSEAVALSVLATETLAKGDVVKVTGWNNGQDLPEVAKTTSASDTAFAVITAAVASGAMGYATNTGVLQDINTNAYNVGDILYANGSGGFTATKPTSGNYQPCAYVMRKNTNNGVIYVEFSTPRIVERSDNTASTIVLRDASGNFSAGTITATAVNTTTIDLTNLEVTNIKAKDGTASATIADSTGVMTIGSSVLTTTDINGGTIDGVTIGGASAGVGTFTTLNATTVNTTTLDLTNLEVTNIKAKDGTAAATIADSTGKITVSTELAVDNLNLSGNAITSTDTNGNIDLTPNGTGEVNITKVDIDSGAIDGTTIGGSSAAAGTFTTVAGTTGNITTVNATTVDTTNIEVTNVKAKDGTASIAIADSTGVATISAAPVLSALTASQAVFTDASKGLVSNAITGTGNVVMSASPTLTGTVTAATINATTLGGTLSTAAQPNVTSVGTLTSLTVSSGIAVNSLGTAVSNFADGLSVAGYQSIGWNTANGNSLAIGGYRSSQWSNLEFYTSGTRRASLDTSGNLAVDTNTLYVDAANNRVGVGTASPGYPLDVQSAIGEVYVKSTTGTNYAAVQTSNTGGSFYAGLNNSAGNAFSTTAYSAILWHTGAYPMVFATSNAEKMRLDASGNLGLGVTPSAWQSAWKVLETQGGFLGGGGTTYIELGQNFFYDGAFKYKANGLASLYEQSAGLHKWYLAPNNTSGAGAALTFTQAMTLDASGNLGVGTTSPAYKLEVVAGTGSLILGAFRTGDSTAANNAGGGFVGTSSATAGSRNARMWLDADGANFSGSDYFYIDKVGNSGIVELIQVSNAAMTFHTNGTERARIESGGNMVLGATSASPVSGNTGSTNFTVSGSANPTTAYPSYRLRNSDGSVSSYWYINQGNGAVFGTSTNHYQAFFTNDTERARITSGGYFKASNDGTYPSPTGSSHELVNNANGSTLASLTHKGSDPYGTLLVFSTASPDNNSNYFAKYEDSTALRCVIWSDGDIQNHDGVYGTISDERLKQDIVDASSQWDDLKAVRFRKYRMKTDVAADPNAPYQLGVIAQELEQTSPGLVDEHPNFEEQEVTDEDGNVTTERVQVGTTKTVKSSILLMKAAVALQEAMARIEALEARLEALEA